MSAAIKNNTALEVIALKPDNSGAIFILERGVENVVCSQFRNDTAIPNSINNIGIFDVLEHIENEAKFLSSIHTTLKDDSMLYLTVPSYKWLWSIEDDHDKHFRRYSKRNLNQLLKSQGFKIVYSSYFFLYLFPLFCLEPFPLYCV